jgi:hypothetical protein
MIMSTTSVVDLSETGHVDLIMKWSGWRAVPDRRRS